MKIYEYNKEIDLVKDGQHFIGKPLKFQIFTTNGKLAKEYYGIPTKFNAAFFYIKHLYITVDNMGRVIERPSISIGGNNGIFAVGFGFPFTKEFIVSTLSPKEYKTYKAKVLQLTLLGGQ